MEGIVLMSQSVISQPSHLQYTVHYSWGWMSNVYWQPTRVTITLMVTREYHTNWWAARAGALGQWLAPLPFTSSGFGSRSRWFERNKNDSSPFTCESIAGSLRDREVACSTSDRQGSNFESCVWRTVSSHSSHHPQDVLRAQFSLYVHKGGIKPDSFHFI